jgi:hypothetical protein
MRKALYCLLLLVAFTSLGCRKLLSKMKKGRDAPTPTTTAAPLATEDPEPALPAVASRADGVDVELGELRVTMPGKPKTLTKREPSPAGTVVITRNEVTIGDSYFASSVIDVPDAKTWSSEGSVAGAIDNALASVRAQPGTKLVRATRDRPVKVGDLEGRDVTAVIERSDGSKLHARLLSVSRTRRNCFILSVVHSDDDPLVRAMFASLRPGTP